MITLAAVRIHSHSGCRSTDKEKPVEQKQMSHFSGGLPGLVLCLDGGLAALNSGGKCRESNAYPYHSRMKSG